MKERRYNQTKAESKEHEKAGFVGGCPFPQADERMGIRDRILGQLGIAPDNRDADFLEDYKVPKPNN